MESASSTLRKGEKKAGVLRFKKLLVASCEMLLNMLCQDQVTETEAFACWRRGNQRSGNWEKLTNWIAGAASEF